MLTINIEKLADVRDECQGLIEQHWQEIAVWQDIPLAPNWLAYEQMEGASALVIYTVRDDARLVGYAVFFMRSHIHYKNHVWALNDIIWVHPDYRNGRIGLELTQFWENDLKSRNVHVVHVNAKVAHPALGYVLKQSQYQTVEIGYEKRLN